MDIEQREKYEYCRMVLKTLSRTRDDFQDTRERVFSRCGMKKNGKPYKATNQRMFDEDMQEYMIGLGQVLLKKERECEKQLRVVLEHAPIYGEWLANVKGIREVTAGWIIGEFDIYKATTVSKMCMFAGLNPDMTYGVKCKKKGNKLEYIRTDILVPADRLTRGYVSPFNRKLRTALVGRMADVFIKLKNEYALNHYYPYKEQLAQSDDEVIHEGKSTPWKNVSKAHRDRAARRYMTKKFLQDLYNAWRPLHGLLVLPSYTDEQQKRRADNISIPD